ncbi:MAG TPA: tripartite tricarboxylate transporter substrate-binding protein [Xanthobacteraceae bacterium]|jgi:tripartite-type tricarboxylate transporter receptor subunit TctC
MRAARRLAMAADTVVRPVADKLSRRLGQAVIVEDKPGAAPIVGTGAVIQPPAGGYTLLQASTNKVIATGGIKGA